MNTIVLLHPEIPPNTGTIARLCVVTNTRLHLVGTLGFELTDKYLKRASMDYWQHLQYEVFPDIDTYYQQLPMERSFLFSTKATQHYTATTYPQDSFLVFGNESSGTPSHIQTHFELHKKTYKIPMKKEHRSLNIAISTGIVLYEVFRQHDFDGLV